MANTISNNISTLAQASLDGFVSVLAPIRGFSTDFSPKAGQPGAAVQVNLYGATSTGNAFAGDYTQNADSSIGSVTVNLNNHWYKTVHVTDRQLQEQGADLYKLGYYAGQAVAKNVVVSAQNLLTTGAIGSSPLQILGNANNFSVSGMLAGRTASVAWGSEKNCIMDAAYYSALLGNLPSSTTVQDNSTREGSIGKLYGFNLYETDVSPMVASQSQTKVIFASPDAVAIAARPLVPEDGGTYIATEQVTDPKSNVTLGTRLWYDPAAGKKYFTTEILCGMSIGNPSGAKVIWGN